MQKPAGFLHEKTCRIGRLCGNLPHQGFPTGLCYNLERFVSSGQLGGARALMRRHFLRMLKRAAIGEIGGNCSGAQSKCGGRAIKGGFRRRLAETGGGVRRTLFGLLAIFDDRIWAD